MFTLITLPNVNALVIGDIKNLKQRIAILDQQIDLANKFTSELEATISFLTANPNHPDNQFMVLAKQTLTIVQTLSGAYKTYRQETVDQVKWEDQEGNKQVFPLSKSA